MSKNIIIELVYLMLRVSSTTIKIEKVELVMLENVQESQALLLTFDENAHLLQSEDCGEKFSDRGCCLTMVADTEKIQQRLEMMQHSVRAFTFDAATQTELFITLRRQWIVVLGFAFFQAGSGQLAIMYHMHYILQLFGFFEDCSSSLSAGTLKRNHEIYLPKACTNNFIHVCSSILIILVSLHVFSISLLFVIYLIIHLLLCIFRYCRFS